jgi:transcriptional regulator with XRE-family HTH domain
MKQFELAEKLNISTSYLSEIEAGKKPASIELLDSYAKVFGIPASTFLLFKEQMAGAGEDKRVEKAKKMLQFFEWVAREEDDDGHPKKTSQAGKAPQAIRA